MFRPGRIKCTNNVMATITTPGFQLQFPVSRLSFFYLITHSAAHNSQQRRPNAIYGKHTISNQISSIFCQVTHESLREFE